jgi:hypothetical protein
VFAHFIQIRFADKNFYCLLTCGFLQQFTSAYLSVKWVINSLIFLLKSLFFLFNFFIIIFHMWNLSWLNISALTLVWQAQQQQQQQYHHVSVIQICVSELTTCRVLVLYNAYIAVFILADTDVNSVLKVDQQQLALYAHFSQTMVILTLLSDNILFVQIYHLQQIRTHQLLYINAILIQSQSMLISDSCTDCQKCSMTLFLKCHHTSKHFSEVLWQLQVTWSCCSLLCTQQWCTHCHQMMRTTTVQWEEHIAKLRQIALILLLMKTVIIDLNL